MSHKLCKEKGCESPRFQDRAQCLEHYREYRNRLAAARSKIKCTFETCNRGQHAGGLCAAHYEQRRSGGELTHIEPVAIGLFDDDGNRYCKTCRTFRPVSEFYKLLRSSDGMNPNCRWCLTAKNFGTTRQYLQVLLEEQNHRCAICRTDQPGGKWNTFHVDHDHGCCPEGGRSCGKCIRQYLCNRCNQLLGLARDEKRVLLAAVEYLDKWEAGGYANRHNPAA